jgi:hypothetical protein
MDAIEKRASDWPAPIGLLALALAQVVAIFFWSGLDQFVFAAPWLALIVIGVLILFSVATAALMQFGIRRLGDR